jgi:hypothetical protein
MPFIWNKNVISKINRQGLNECKKGVFYNSKKSNCSIYESGVQCYNALKSSNIFELHYSESTFLDTTYDFAIFNYHDVVNNWVTANDILRFNKPSFCVVTEVTYMSESSISRSPNFFDHYIVLDPSVSESDKIHAFPRPLKNFDDSNNKYPDIVTVGTFGFATEGKGWDSMIQNVNDNFDQAIIKINIPHATHVPYYISESILLELKYKASYIITKPDIKLELTHEYFSEDELIDWCSKNTINVFLYNRSSTCGFTAGLSAVTDQAIASGKPILVSSDPTFRHIHKYIKAFPEIDIKNAIIANVEGTSQMKRDWSSKSFCDKFEKIILQYKH